MERWPVALIFVAGAAFGALGAMTWSACMAVARQPSPRDGEEAAVFELKGQFCERDMKKKRKKTVTPFSPPP